MDKKTILLTLTTVLLAACSNDDSPSANPDAIILTANMGEPSATRGTQEVQTLAFDSGELVKVECTPSGSNLQSVIYKAAAPSANQNVLTPYSRALTWPAAGTVGIRAYYPSTVASTQTSFTVQADQSLDDDYKQSDLMYATPLSAQAKVSSVPLTFHHALSKIVINLTAGNGITANDLATCVVAVKACKTVTIANGVATASTATANGWIAIGTGAATAGIIVPQTIDGSSTAQPFVRVTMGTTDLYFKLTGSKSFVGRKKYTYTLRVSATDLTLASVRINDWDDSNGANTTSPEPMEI